MKIVITVILMMVTVLVIQEVARIAYLAKKSRDIDKNPIIFSQKGEMSYSILIIGDRSVFASGHEDPFDSLPGILSTKLEPGNIEVDGKPEMVIEDLSTYLSARGGTSFDAIIISVGENDILHRKNPEAIRHELEEALTIARDLSEGNVILIAPRNIGVAPIMPPILPGKYTELTDDYSKMYSDIAYQTKIEFIHSYYVGEITKNITKDQYYLADKFHLSKYGNEAWVNGIVDNSKLLRAFAK